MKQILVYTGILVISISVLPVFSYAQATSTSTSNTDTQIVPARAPSGQNCSTIDTNWRTYGQTIRGANQKVSDVVLNACAALGGIQSCRFNSGCRYRVDDNNRPVDARARARQARGCTSNKGGATASQHLYSNAIDLNVPQGRQAEFITLAICGLRRVNDCKGGVGLYQGGSIHVDVRSSSNAIWSNDYTAASVAKLHDVSSKSVLYGFQGGSCTGGNIDGNYGETQMYGAPVQYTPPKDMFGTAFNAQRGYTQPATGSANNISPIGPPLNPTDIPFIDPPSPYTGGSYTNGGIFDSPTNADTNTGTSADATKLFVSQIAPVTQANGIPPTLGRTTQVTCEKNGLFGTSLFSTCDTKSTTTISTSTAQTATQQNHPTRAPLLSSNLFKKDSTRGLENNQRTTQGTLKVFYGVHNPDAVSNFTGDSYTQYGSRGAFGNGPVQDTATITPGNVVRDATHFLEQSAQYGAYFGFIHALSPLVLGSAPRTLLRIGEQFTGVYVNNPFEYR